MRSSPKIAGYRPELRGQLRRHRHVPDLPPFSFARTAISSSRYSRSLHFEPENLGNPHARGQRGQNDQAQTEKRLVDALAGLPVHLLIESCFQPGDLLRIRYRSRLVIRPLHLHLISRIPVDAGFLATRSWRPSPSCGA